MSAYMIVTAKLADREAFISGYGAAAGRLVGKFGGKYVLRSPGAKVLEGEFGGIDFNGASMVISEWPDLAAAEAFWRSPEYAEVKKLRANIADCQVLLIEAAKINDDVGAGAEAGL